MKSLYLWRHAKADWGSIDQDDHDRCLAPRGNQAAPRMAMAMKERDFIPDQIFCSSARRTRQTLAHFQEIMGGDIPTVIDRNLYLASPQTILKVIGSAKSNLDSILILAHNPGLEDLAAKLCGPQSEVTPNFPTSGMAAFEFQIESWKDVKPGSGNLVAFLTPKTLSD